MMHQQSINRQIKRTAKDSLFYLPTALVSAVVGILLIRVLTALFTPEEYGRYQITLVTFGLVNLFGLTWLSSSVVRFYQGSLKESSEKCFLSTVFWGAFLGTQIVAAASLGILFVIKSRLAPQLFHSIIIAIIASIFCAFFEIFISIYRAGFQAKKYAVYFILYSVGKPVVGVLLILFFGLKVNAIFWAFISVSAVLNIFVINDFSLVSIIKNHQPSKETLGVLYRYGSQITLTMLAFWILTFSDRYLIAYFLQTEQVGFYSVGHNISEKTLSFLYSVLMLAAYPIIVHNWENFGREHTQQLITELSKYYLIMFVPVLLVLIIIPSQVLLLFASGKFIDGASVLPLIAVGFFLNGLAQYAIKGFELNKRTRNVATIALTVSAINIILNILLIPRIGMLGAGLAACLSYLLYFLLAIWGTRAHLRYRLPWRTVRIVFLSSVVFSGIILFGKLMANGAMAVTLSMIPIALITYFFMLYFFGEIDDSVINKFWGITKRLASK